MEMGGRAASLSGVVAGATQNLKSALKEALSTGLGRSAQSRIPGRAARRQIAFGRKRDREAQGELPDVPGKRVRVRGFLLTFAAD